LLEAEGVAFDARGRIDLEQFAWSGLSAERPQNPEAGPAEQRPGGE